MRSFVGDEQEFIRMCATPVTPFFEGRLVAQRNVLSRPEETAFFDEYLYFFSYGIFLCRRLEIVVNFFDREGIIEKIEIGEYF